MGWGEVGDAVFRDDIVEERMAVGDSTSGRQSAELLPEKVAEPTLVAEKGSEMVRTEPVLPEKTADTISKAEKTTMGEGWVGYCRKCRQRHCCEAVDQPPAPTVLFPEL